MGSRLLLGYGGVGHFLVEMARDGEEDVYVVTPAPQDIRNGDGGVTVTAAEPSDPAALADLDVDSPISSVFVGTDDPARNVEIVRAAREAFPDVPLVTYFGREPTGDQREELSELADTTIDYKTALVEHVRERAASEPSVRAHALGTLLGDLEGTLGVILHDNPDPDAIASGIALTHLARTMGAEAEPVYGGEISHQENRALVNLLDLELTELEPADRREGGDLPFDAVALVDHSLPGVNDRLPEELPVDVVIDHHPPHGPVDARHIDVRPDVGATSTILVEYLTELGVEVDQRLATALLFGIRTDTNDFSRGASPLDFEAAAALLPDVDEDALDAIEDPTVSRETLATIARAIREARVRDGTATSCIGRFSDRDSLSQAAEQLMSMEGISATVVYGFSDGTIYLSGRARGSDVDIGEVLRDAFDQIGSAGGHAEMGGGQLPMGLLGEEDVDDERLAEIVREVIDARFYEAFDAQRRRRRRWTPADLVEDHWRAD